MTVADRIIAYLHAHPDGADDDELAIELSLNARQHANAECRRLAQAGRISRRSVGGKLRNFAVAGVVVGPRSPVDSLPPAALRRERAAAGPVPSAPIASRASGPTDGEWLAASGFLLLGPLAVERDAQGVVRRLDPASEYRHAASERIHTYGLGPFCRFRIPAHLVQPAVYVLVVEGRIAYVGSAANLATRFNTGYGQISPRNCYNRGQLTNCRINALIRDLAERGVGVDLWWRHEPNPKQLESRLIVDIRPPWNRTRR